MSSSRVAIASGVLIVALAAGTWSAVGAFPLYSAAAEPQTQTPPRDPMTPERHHRVAVELWERANKDTSLTPQQRIDAIERGIAAEDRALAMKPEYVEALIYKNIFLRMLARDTSDPQERQTLLRQADDLREKALELRRIPPPTPPPPPPVMVRSTPGPTSSATMPAPPPPPPPPPSSDYFGRIEALNAVRIGGNIKAPSKVRDVRPIYPPIAQASRVQGVVIIETLIDPEGKVTDARVLRSIPLLDQAALDAVRQWEYVPTLMNGVPQSVVMTVTVNFSLQ